MQGWYCGQEFEGNSSNRWQDHWNHGFSASSGLSYCICFRHTAIRLLLRALPCSFLLKPKQLKGLDQTGSWQGTLVESSIMDEWMDKRTEGRDGWISCIRRATKLYFCPDKPALGQSQQLVSLPPPLIVRSNHEGIPALNKELLLQNATEYSTMCNDTILRNRTCSTDLVIICYDKSSLTRPTCLDSKSQTVG